MDKGLVLTVEVSQEMLCTLGKVLDGLKINNLTGGIGNSRVGV
jgi:hypothetical protein